MKHIMRSISLATAFFLLVILVDFTQNQAFAQAKKLFPLKAGYVYNVEFVGTDGTITIVTPPDASGWAVVDIESGFKGLKLSSRKSVGLNMNLVVMIEELGDAKTVRASLLVKVNKDAIINDLNNIAAQAYQFRIRPSSMGGGQGSYMGFVLPAKMAQNENAFYTTMNGADEITVVATSTKDEKSSITVTVTSDGRLTNWNYGGAFK